MTTGMTILLAAVALGAGLSAIFAIRAISLSHRYCEQLEARLTESETRIVELGSLATALMDQSGSFSARLDKVQVGQHRITSSGKHAGFNEAIALARHGASTEELIDTCTLSIGEANLVSRIYGSSAISG